MANKMLRKVWLFEIIGEYSTEFSCVFTESPTFQQVSNILDEHDHNFSEEMYTRFLQNGLFLCLDRWYKIECKIIDFYGE